MLKYKDKLKKRIGKDIDMPELTNSTEVYIWNIFSELSSSRHEAEPISYSDMLSYFTIESVHKDEWGMVKRIVKVLDRVWLNDMAKKREKANAKNK